MKNWFHSMVRWKVANGEKASFWKDNWLVDDKLAISYARLFFNSLQQEDMIENMGVWDGDR